MAKGPHSVSLLPHCVKGSRVRDRVWKISQRDQAGFGGFCLSFHGRVSTLQSASRSQSPHLYTERIQARLHTDDSGPSEHIRVTRGLFQKTPLPSSFPDQLNYTIQGPAECSLISSNSSLNTQAGTYFENEMSEVLIVGRASIDDRDISPESSPSSLSLLNRLFPSPAVVHIPRLGLWTYVSWLHHVSMRSTPINFHLHQKSIVWRPQLIGAGGRNCCTQINH